MGTVIIITVTAFAVYESMRAVGIRSTLVRTTTYRAYLRMIEPETTPDYGNSTVRTLEPGIIVEASRDKEDASNVGRLRQSKKGKRKGKKGKHKGYKRKTKAGREKKPIFSHSLTKSIRPFVRPAYATKKINFIPPAYAQKRGTATSDKQKIAIVYSKG